MHFSLENIRKAITGLKKDLDAGFIQTDIWNSGSMKSAAFNHTQGLLPIYGLIPKHIKLISEISQMLKKTLIASDYPFTTDYLLINLKENKVLMILYYNIGQEESIASATGRPAGAGEEMSEYQQFILVDMNKTTMGTLMGIAVPNMLENIR
jgi:hypothetical protein